MKGLIPAARAALRRMTGRIESRAALMSGSSSITRIIVVAIVLLLTAAGCTSVAVAAGSCTYVGVTRRANNPDSTNYFRYTCVAHTDGSLSATLDVSPMQGSICSKFITTPIIASTDASDLAITGNGITVVATAGFGLDMIDATSTKWNSFESPTADGGSRDFYEPTYGKNATVVVTNNIVSQSSFYLDFICY